MKKKVNEMSEKIEIRGTKLTEEEKTGVTEFVKSLSDILKSDLESIVLYGSGARQDYRPGKSDINLLVVVKRIDFHILKSVYEPVQKGRRFGIAPFILTQNDLQTSTDAFPVKFMSIKESSNVLWGSDALIDLKIDQEHIRLRCEQELKNLLLRMRRNYLIGGGRGLADFMVQSVGGFLENLRFILYLSEGSMPPREKVVGQAVKKYGLDADALKKVLSLRNREEPPPREETEKLYGQFMSIVEKVSDVADKLEGH